MLIYMSIQFFVGRYNNGGSVNDTQKNLHKRSTEAFLRGIPTHPSLLYMFVVRTRNMLLTLKSKTGGMMNLHNAPFFIGLRCIPKT